MVLEFLSIFAIICFKFLKNIYFFGFHIVSLLMCLAFVHITDLPTFASRILDSSLTSHHHVEGHDDISIKS